MAATWTISTLERNTSDDGVVVAHWRVTDVDGDHSGSSTALVALLLMQKLKATQPIQTSLKIWLLAG